MKKLLVILAMVFILSSCSDLGNDDLRLDPNEASNELGQASKKKHNNKDSDGENSSSIYEPNDGYKGKKRKKSKNRSKYVKNNNNSQEDRPKNKTSKDKNIEETDKLLPKDKDDKKDPDSNISPKEKGLDSSKAPKDKKDMPDTGASTPVEGEVKKPDEKDKLEPSTSGEEKPDDDNKPEPNGTDKESQDGHKEITNKGKDDKSGQKKEDSNKQATNEKEEKLVAKSIYLGKNHVKYLDVGLDNYNVNKTQKLIDDGNIISTVTKFNPKDNEITYFSGHTYNFGSVARLKKNSIVTVTDAKGRGYKYKIVDFKKYRAGDVESNAPFIGGYHLMNLAGDGIGVESIVIQYCDENDIPIIFLGLPL